MSYNLDLPANAVVIPEGAFGGFTKREMAAIMLKVPLSGDKELDAMIRQATGGKAGDEVFDDTFAATTGPGFPAAPCAADAKGVIWWAPTRRTPQGVPVWVRHERNQKWQAWRFGFHGSNQQGRMTAKCLAPGGSCQCEYWEQVVLVNGEHAPPEEYDPVLQQR